jgi:hypothetical protein
MVDVRLETVAKQILVKKESQDLRSGAHHFGPNVGPAAIQHKKEDKHKSFMKQASKQMASELAVDRNSQILKAICQWS